MSIQITVRNVPTEVRDELAARAAQQGKSMQEYLREALQRMAARPQVEQVLARMRERKMATGTQLTATSIVSARDADRR